jgi:hypothetical protein
MAISSYVYLPKYTETLVYFLLPEQPQTEALKMDNPQSLPVL